MKDPIILSPATFHHLLYIIYNRFLNKSEAMILKDSALVNHRVPTRAGNLLVINLNKKTVGESTSVSLQLDKLKTRINNLNKLNGNKDIKVFYDDDTGLYYFTNESYHVSIPRLNDRQVAYYQYDDVPNIPLDLFLDYHPSHDELIKQLTNQGIIFLRVHFDSYIIKDITKTGCFDILIKDNYVIGFQHEDLFIQHDESGFFMKEGDVERHDADYILRSHAFQCFAIGKVSELKLYIARDAVGSYWLISSGHYLTALEDPKPDFTAYEHLEVLIR